MQIIGITGRSGCGKSTLTDSIRAAGFRCVDATRWRGEVLLPGSPCIVQLQQEFGESDIVDEAGQVRRRLLADRAFATPQGTARLTAITQPEIYHRLDLAMAEAAGGGKALLCGRRGDRGYPVPKAVQPSRLVAAPYETSVQRICARDALRRKWRAAAWTLSCPKMSCVPPQTL